MRVDWRTLQDLSIFDLGGFQASVFDWANFTRTHGGARLLKERFHHPFTDVSEIRNTQAAVAWLAENASLFDSLLGGSAWLSTERYAESSFTALDHPNRLILFLDSAWVRYRHADLYREIVAALSLAQMLSRHAADVVESLEALRLPDILTAWRTEMRQCLDIAPLLRLRESRAVHRLWVYRVLELDRGLRTADFIPLKQLAALVYQIDALRSLALATRERKLTLPEVLDAGPLTIEAEGLYHPLLENPVENPLQICADRRLMFLTGPNMAGKSVYLKAAGIATYLAQLGMGVPARRFRLTPFACLFSGINTTDNVRLGQSYFFAEVRRVREITDLLAQGTHALVLFDEMFKGTNLKDASDACLAVLSGFAACQNSAFMVASHIAELAAGIENLEGVQFVQFGAEIHGGTAAFDYRVRPGVSQQRLGMLILEREGVLARLRQLQTPAPLS